MATRRREKKEKERRRKSKLGRKKKKGTRILEKSYIRVLQSGRG